MTGKSSGNVAPTIVTVLLVVSLLLWAGYHDRIQSWLCPQPVRAGGVTLSCTGTATVQLPDGTSEVIHASPSPEVAARR